jgi:hypothetical protein
VEEEGSESGEEGVGKEIEVEDLWRGVGRWADGAHEVASKGRVFRRGVRRSFGF